MNSAPVSKVGNPSPLRTRPWYPSLGTRCLPLLLGLALLFSLVVPGIAHASKWDVTTVWAGKTTYPNPSTPTGIAEDTWSSDGSNTGKLINLGVDSATVNTMGKVTITYTWNDEGSGEPAPDHVFIIESGRASYADHISYAYNPNNLPDYLFTGSFTGTASCSVANSVSTGSGTPSSYFNADVTGACGPLSTAHYQNIPAGEVLSE